MILTDGQRQALEELSQIVGEDADAIAFLGPPGDAPIPDHLSIRIGLAFGEGLAPGGVALEACEPVTLWIPADFPFAQPISVLPPDRFAEQPHVMWGRYLCLYQAINDWQPRAGMFGYLGRLADWYVRAAEGTLEETGQPLHPPVTRPSTSAGQVIVHADLHRPAAERWLGAALLARKGEDRFDVVSWAELADIEPLEPADLTAYLAERAPRTGAPMSVAPVVMLPVPLTFEYPRTVGHLISAIEERGVSLADLFELLETTSSIGSRAAAAEQNAVETEPVTLLLGSPMRGVGGDAERLTHLTAWRLDLHAQTALSLHGLLAIVRNADGVEVQAMRDSIELFADWVQQVPLSWAVVHEQRPQIVTRRDVGRPATWLAGKNIAILGCGALGARIAEHCARAGAVRLYLADRGVVNPGILVRQPYSDGDIGRAKADVLSERLTAIRPDVEVAVVHGDVLHRALGTDLPSLLDTDLIIDATANPAVAARIERLRWTRGRHWPALLMVGVGHDARIGLGLLVRPEATGAGVDLLHRVAVHTSMEPEMADVAVSLFSVDEHDPFQPEPGCSEPTFRGADCDVAAAAANLFTWAVHRLENPIQHRTAFVTRLPPATQNAELAWCDDLIIEDEEAGYQIRVWPEIIEDLRTECLLATEGTETGGILLGDIDDAARVVWITAAEPPPPDSVHAPHFFQHGLDGVEECIERRHAESLGRRRFVGMWHSHPNMRAAMSKLDRAAMTELLVPVPSAPRRAVALIIGGPTAVWRSWLDGTGLPELHAQLCHRVTPWHRPPPTAL